MNLTEEIKRIKEIMGVEDSKEKESKNPEIVDKSFDISYDYNPEVESLQKVLKDKGYYIGKYGSNEDGVDGKYGPMTKAAHESLKQGISPEKFEKDKTKITQQFIGDVSDSTLKNEFNFHIIPDGKNNYRSAQLPVTLNGKDFLGEVIDKYGIKTIIRFNGDGGDSKHRSSHPMTSIDSERSAAESKGVKFHKLSSTKDQSKVNDLLSQGNVLIHCAHGADRTGGNVGGYLKSIGFGDTNKIWSYTTQYNGWNKMIKGNPTGFVKGGYLKQAQKFGVRDLSHAEELAGSK